ncbi:MAG: hypothetical protein ACPG47_09970 [Leucothrix sp.]
MIGNCGFSGKDIHDQEIANNTTELLIASKLFDSVVQQEIAYCKEHAIPYKVVSDGNVLIF